MIKLSFTQYLEEFEGITWNYFDNNFDGEQAEEIYERYNDYLKGDDEEEGS